MNNALVTSALSLDSSEYGDDGSGRWLRVMQTAFGHRTYLLRASAAPSAMLPLALVESRLFGRFLVGLPYVNTAGVRCTNSDSARDLIDQAVRLADELDVRYLELRHESPVEHAALTGRNDSKVLMRLPLPATAEKLWDGLKAKVRNQVRKARTFDLTVCWGRDELLSEFFSVFSRNMRDLGTPVYGRRLFASILREFAAESEFCVVRRGAQPIAAALLLHQHEATEVPSASALRSQNFTNANMLMYWHLLERAVGRGSRVFDFGRSTIDSNTYRFKVQWGARPHPTCWQYYIRRGTLGDMRPETSRFRLAARVWRRLPLPLANWLGPHIVRGIP